MEAIINAARLQRAAYQQRLDEIVERGKARVAADPTAEPFTDEDAAEFKSLTKSLKRADKDIDKWIVEQARSAAATAASADEPEVRDDKSAPVKVPVGDGVVRSEPMTYDKFSGQSYFRDLATLAARSLDQQSAAAAPAAEERMRQHGHEVEVEARTDRQVADRLAEIRATPPGLEQRVNPNTTAGTGGEFVPPLWLVSQYVPYARPGRVFANRVSNQTLPPGIDVINIPKITTGSQVAIQSANAAAVQSVDIVTSTVACNVNTIAGQEDISMQLLEQSPLAMDGVIFQDLSADYDQRLDLQVISGSGANGQHLGVLSVTQGTSNTSITKASGITVSSATFMDASTSATQYRSIVNGVNQVETLRFASPTAIWCHPRRANSWAYAADTTARPLFTPAKYGQFNQLGTNEGSPVFQGVAGELYGLPVVKDANMSTTMSGTAVTGGTADAVVVLKEDDLILWEGTMRMRPCPRSCRAPCRSGSSCIATAPSSRAVSCRRSRS